MATSATTIASAAVAGAELSGPYKGLISADFASTAGLTVQVSGQQSALAASFALDAGARIDCHGNRPLGARSVLLTGHRTGVGSDGSATFDFSGQFEFDAEVHVVVDVTIDNALLTANGRTFAGTVGLRVRPDFLSDCVRSWAFTTTQVPSQPVPSVLDMTVPQARSTLWAAGLQVTVIVEIDWACNTRRGRIMRQTPKAGTLVLPGSMVKIYAADHPPQCL
ncbi:PASTA domain-containing protein [Acrocarpospora sp. B8E8]|uniref:PASTA domain-containing protein n=1 Tax=Acrocarpospora sp. B8E8 TaxID=3153572 RepID=UPI00325FA437